EVASRSVTAGARAHHALVRIQNAALRGSSLTKQLVEFGRGQPSTAEPIALDATIDEMRPMLSLTLGAGVTLSLALGAEGAMVRAEPGDLRQVLLNLASNARDAMPEGGELLIAS